MTLSTMPPVVPFIGFGLTCFLTTLMPSTLRWSASTRATTLPRLPLSRPVNTMTSSPVRILFMARPLTCLSSEHFRCERNDLHEALGTQFTRDRAEDAGADRLELGIQQDGGLAVELDQRAVLAANALGGANDEGTVDLALLHAATRRSFLDADLDHVTNAGITALRAAEHLDALDGLRTGVVRDVESRLHLNHGLSPTCS